MRDTTFDYTVKTLKQAPETSVNLDADVKMSMQNKLSTLLNKQPIKPRKVLGEPCNDKRIAFNGDY